METKERSTNSYILPFLPVGVGAMIWAILGFPLEKAGAGLIAFSIVTVFFSSYLRIQLPRTKIHLTIADALIFLALLIYGGEIAVLMAVFEAGFTSLNLRRQGVSISAKTILVNILVAAVSVFSMSLIVASVFPSTDAVLADADLKVFALLLAVMALSQFLVNSFCVALVVAAKTENSFWQVWKEYCLIALVMFIGGAFMAGLMAKAMQQIDVLLFGVVIAVFALVYLTYRRFADDVKRTEAKAEQSERERAEQAEEHVKELKHYVSQLEQTGRELEQSREKFRHAAYHDSLTDLPNRNQFIETIDGLLRKARKDSTYRFALLYLDLHSFKTVNDSLGHSMGDRLISQVAERLVTMVKASDLVGRFGGDEFAILLPGVGDPDNVTNLAKAIIERIAEPFLLDERQVFTRASVGIAIGGSEYKKAEDILRDADMAMYRAKEKNRSYVIFDKIMLSRALSLLQLETDLRFAIERNEFELYYQPIVDLERSRMIGFEALVRWNHPVLGKMEPESFIPVCEATGLIVPMTIQILESACRQLVEWQARPDCREPLFVSVNLSGKHFAHPKLVDHISEVLEKTKINPRSLKLEITETAVMENAESATLMLRQIKDLGVQLSIDDFGTGYSSLSYLQRFPIDTLKIDRAFVRSMEDGRQNGEIVRAVLALAEALKLTVIAEGIESIHQLHQLRILNCQYGQGYLFSPPLPPAEFETLIGDQSRWQNLVSGGTFAIVIPSHDYNETLVQ